MPDKPTNEYTPRAWPVRFTDREKAIATDAFNAGRKFEADLFANVIATIVRELQAYRAAAKVSDFDIRPNPDHKDLPDAPAQVKLCYAAYIVSCIMLGLWCLALSLY